MEDSDNTPTNIFRPKSRIMVLLGDQLIKNHTLALFELVKNSYDADASEVSITLLDIDNQDSGIIEVRDDGFGMTIDTVRDIWLEPAHGHKSEQRVANRRTEKGRLPVGEKGLGRFAVHRLGTDIEMVTRSKGSSEVVVKIDWDEFLKHEYLDQAEISVEERTPQVFSGNKTGTRITISKLRQQWKRGDVRRLYKSVMSMTPPDLFADKEDAETSYVKHNQPSNETFEVQFEISPKEKWLSGLYSPELAVSQSLFRFDFELTDQGLEYYYKFLPYKPLKKDYEGNIDDRLTEKINLGKIDFFTFNPAEDGISLKSRTKRKSIPLLGKGDGKRDGLGIGPIKGRLIGYDFDPDIYDRYLNDEFGGLRDYLREQGGLRIYRDNLRVYNYGEPGDDWLHLDHRRIQGPTKRLGSRQIMGAIYLDLERSFGLLEKTNREGFVENRSYTELVHAMTTVLTQFEAERNKDKRLLKKLLEVPPGRDGDKVKEKPTTEELIFDLQRDVLKEKAYKPLIPIVENISKTYKETRDVLMSAAGAGLGLVTVFHELERGVRNLHEAISEGLRPKQLEAMSNELVSLLRGAMYMVNTKQMEKLSASRLVEYVLLTQQRRFKRHNIEFLNGFKNSPSLDFEVKGIRRMLTTALVNLIDNAIYWTEGVGEKKYIWIAPSHDLEYPSIVISDNGPGFIDEVTELVQPFYTRKPGGMGIGLYYTDMVMKSHGGRLAFPEKNAIERPLVTDGACIALVFKESK